LCYLRWTPMQLTTSGPLDCKGFLSGRHQKPNADMNFPPPHHTAGTARLVAIEDKVEDPGDRAVNLDLGPRVGKIANDARNGTAGGPNYSGAFQRPCSWRRSAVSHRCPAIVYAAVLDGSGVSGRFHLRPLQPLLSKVWQSLKYNHTVTKRLRTSAPAAWRKKDKRPPTEAAAYSGLVELVTGFFTQRSGPALPLAVHCHSGPKPAGDRQSGYLK
jgi:hypothetical protein